MPLTWLRGANPFHKRLATQLCGIFVVAEGAGFEFRMGEFLPDIVKLLDVVHSDSEEPEDRESDLLLIQCLYTLIKMAQHCPAGLQSEKNCDVVDQMWTKIVYHLKHPHLWIRTLSSRLVGTLLGWHKADDIAAYVVNPSEEKGRSYFFHEDVKKRLRCISRDLVAQLETELLDNQLADQVIKNLVFIGKIANRIPVSEDEVAKTPTLPWLTSRLRNEVNSEVVLSPTIPTKVNLSALLT